MNNCKICDMHYNPEKSMGLGVSKGTDYEFGNTTQAFQSPMPITLCDMHHEEFVAKYIDGNFGSYIREVSKGLEVPA